MAKMLDWYSHKGVQKFLTKQHNPHFDKHHIKIPFRMLIVGNSGSGKTSTLMNLIYNMSDTFEEIIICCKSKAEPLYEFLEDKYTKDKSVKIMEFGKDGLPDIDKFDKEKQRLLIFDDLVNEKNQKAIEEAFIRARKKNCSLAYLSQSYYAVPKMIRNNLTYIIIKQLSSLKNLTMIMREYSLGVDKKEMKEMYDDATSDKQGFLMLDLEGDKEKRFRSGFNDFYETSSEKLG
jgi:ABC-type dipeptide/oligopeptide/nickel transport system ATPase component